MLGSLRTVYDRYMADVFGFIDTHRYHLDGVSSETPERELRMLLLRVENAANDVIARIKGGPPDRDPNRP